MSTPHDPPPPAVMLRLVMGYWVSQAVGVAARLGIADQLADGPKTSDAMAGALGTHADATYRLCRALASVGVLSASADRTFALTPLGATLRTGPGTLRNFAIAETAEGHWLPWGRFADAVKTGTRTTVSTIGQELWEWYGQHEEEAVFFSGAMASLSTLVAGEVIAHVTFRGDERFADIGGAHGSLLSAILAAHPETTGVLFDLPHVISTAKLPPAMAGRVELVGGDFFESVPGGADIYLLKLVLHDWDDEQARRILRNLRRAARPGARLLVVEMVIPDDGSPTPAQLMDLNMLVMLNGRERTAAEYRALLDDTGFRAGEILATHSPFSIIGAIAV